MWSLFKHEKFLNRVVRRFRTIPNRNATHVLIDFTQIPIQKVGVGVYATNLIEEIAKRSSSRHYTILVQDDENSLDTLERENFKLIKIKSRYFRNIFFRFLLEQIYIPYLTRKHHIDVLHSLHYSFPLLPLRAKKIVTIHDMSFIKFPELHKKLKTIYFNFFIKILPKMADRIITISRSTLNDFILLAGASKDNISVVHLGRPEWHDTIFRPDAVESTLRRLGINHEYLLYVGMIEPRKNIANIIHAFHRLNQSRADLQLVIAGPKGWHYKPVFKLIDRLGLRERICLPDYITIDEKAILMKHAKIFLYPSLYEGFGLPVLEAMSLGVPTITSNVSSMPEIAEDTAILIHPESVDELYEGIIKLINNKQLYNTLKETSVLQSSKFTWEKTATQTIEVYESVMDDDKEL